MRAILDLIMLVLQLYGYVVVASAILSWLVAFDVVNMRNDIVRSIGRTLDAVTEPALRPIRQILPSMGGLDLSPVVLLLAIYFLQRVVVLYLYPAFYNL